MVKRTSREGHCEVPGCTSPIHSRRLCNKHYRSMFVAFLHLKPCACGCDDITQYKFVSGHNTRLLSPEEQSRRGRMNTGDSQRDTGEGKSYRKRKGRHEHRIIAEQKLGRPLLPGEIVHHEDHNKRNNHPDNLEVMTQSEHAALHFKQYHFIRKFFAK